MTATQLIEMPIRYPEAIYLTANTSSVRTGGCLDDANNIRAVCIF
jgi:hypothetical protein